MSNEVPSSESSLVPQPVEARAYRMSPEARAKMSESATRRWRVKSERKAQARRMIELGVQPTVEARLLGNATTRGKPRPPDVIERIAEANRGQERSKAQRRRMSQAQRGKRLSDVHREHIGAGLRGRQISEEHRVKLVEAAYRRTRALTWIDRNQQVWVFRSPLEQSFAEWLDQKLWTWFYEPCRLMLSTGKTYTPDFWVQELGQYVELKMTPSQTGVKRFKQAVADGYNVQMFVKRDVEQLRAGTMVLTP